MARPRIRNKSVRQIFKQRAFADMNFDVLFGIRTSRTMAIQPRRCTDLRSSESARVTLNPAKTSTPPKKRVIVILPRPARKRPA